MFKTAVQRYTPLIRFRPQQRVTSAILKKCPIADNRLKMMTREQIDLFNSGGALDTNVWWSSTIIRMAQPTKNAKKTGHKNRAKGASQEAKRS